MTPWRTTLYISLSVSILGNVPAAIVGALAARSVVGGGFCAGSALTGGLDAGAALAEAGSDCIIRVGPPGSLPLDAVGPPCGCGRSVISWMRTHLTCTPQAAA